MASRLERDQKNNRVAGWLVTAVFHALALLLFAFFGLTYQDPPPEEGIALDFGYEDQGFGQSTQSAVEPTPPTPEDPTEATAVTQDVDPTDVSVSDQPKPKPVERPKPVETPKTQEPAKPQPSNELSSRLNKLKTTGTGSGQGTTAGSGDQGSPTGTPGGGSAGTGTGTQGMGDYRLGSRSANYRPKPTYDCEDEGRVVVKVSVDRSGNVISAEPGVGGSTTSSTCLLERAKQAALKTKWQADPDALETQIGTIVYRFEKN
jgi:outer membrane biosynthesis protein TonB